jgi:hypothetical protein
VTDRAIRAILLIRCSSLTGGGAGRRPYTS